MEIEFDFKEKDYLAFYKYYVDKDNFLNKSINKKAIIIPFLLFVLISLDIINGQFSIGTLVIYSIIAFAYYLFSLYFVRKNSVKMMKYILKEDTNSNIFGIRKLVLSDKGITQICQHSEYNLYWTGIKKAVETTKYIFLFDASFSSVIIPKNEIDHQEFEEYLRSKLEFITDKE